MGELLHAGSLTAASVGACCVALDRPRLRVRELALSAVMMLAMLDIVVGAHVVPIVVWSAVTVALAMVSAVHRRGRAEPPAVARMRMYSALGAILMAALMLLMAGDPGAASHHGASGGALTWVLVVSALGYGVAAGVRARQAFHLLDRVQLASMSGSVLLLAAAHLFG